jgi:hypothetical protein
MVAISVVGGSVLEAQGMRPRHDWIDNRLLRTLCPTEQRRQGLS